MTSSRSASSDLPQITFRHFRPDDALTHLRGEDKATSTWLTGGESTEESVRRWIESTNQNWKDGGPRFTYAIQIPSQEVVGMIEFNVDYSHFAGLGPGDANVSYGLYPEFRGRGLATAALLGIHDVMIDKGVIRAIVRIKRENLKSIELAKRCGYLYSGVVTNGVGIEYQVFVNELRG